MSKKTIQIKEKPLILEKQIIKDDDKTIRKKPY